MDSGSQLGASSARDRITPGPRSKATRNLFNADAVGDMVKPASAFRLPGKRPPPGQSDLGPPLKQPARKKWAPVSSSSFAQRFYFRFRELAHGFLQASSVLPSQFEVPTVAHSRKANNVWIWHSIAGRTGLSRIRPAGPWRVVRPWSSSLPGATRASSPWTVWKIRITDPARATRCRCKWSKAQPSPAAAARPQIIPTGSFPSGL